MRSLRVVVALGTGVVSGITLWAIFGGLRLAPCHALVFMDGSTLPWWLPYLASAVIGYLASDRYRRRTRQQPATLVAVAFALAFAIAPAMWPCGGHREVTTTACGSSGCRSWCSPASP